MVEIMFFAEGDKLEKSFYTNKSGAPMMSAAAKKRIEVSLRKCTPAEQEEFRRAKGRELDTWLEMETV